MREIRQMMNEQELNDLEAKEPLHEKQLQIIVILVLVVIIVVVCVVTAHSSNVVTTNSSTSAKTELLKNGESCILYSMTNNRDPFGNKCKIDSGYVNDYCLTEGVQKRRCLTCSEGKQLPYSCFCDEFEHCPEKEDQSRKLSCINCTKEDNCPCLNSGTCICVGKTTGNQNCNCYGNNYKLDNGEKCACDVLTAENLLCSCLYGFTGKYCEVLIRECHWSIPVTPALKHCNESDESQCFVNDLDGKTQLSCFVLNDNSNKTLKNCTFGT